MDTPPTRRSHSPLCFVSGLGVCLSKYLPKTHKATPCSDVRGQPATKIRNAFCPMIQKSNCYFLIIVRRSKVQNSMPSFIKVIDIGTFIKYDLNYAHVSSLNNIVQGLPSFLVFGIHVSTGVKQFFDNFFSFFSCRGEM